MTAESAHSRRRFGGGLRLAGFAVMLAAAFALATVAGGAIDPDAASEGGPRSDEEDEMKTMTENEHAAADVGGLAIAADGYRLELGGDRFTAGRRGVLRFRVIGPDGVVTDFDDEHQAPLHLIVVRRDLTGFQHLHPRLAADGTWSTPLELPAGGVYRAYADFDSGGHALTLGADLMVRGEFDPVELPAPSDHAAVAGYDVALDDVGGGMLEFTVSRDGEPVEDLQPYLGARGHLVAIRDGDLAYLHVHPEASESSAVIAFAAELPTAGSYRLFLQFRHEGEVRTVAFTREVER